MNAGVPAWLRSAVASRLSDRPAYVVLLELFLVLGWGRAAVAKLMSAPWRDGTQLQEFIADHDPLTIGWYRPLANLISSNGTWLWAAFIVAVELAIAISLFIGRGTAVAIATAIFLNVNFILAGQGNPSIFYILMQVAVGLWLVEGPLPRSMARSATRVVGLLAVVLVVATVPYLKTLDPHAVIDDPAAVLAAGLLCTAVACAISWHRLQPESEHPTIDLRTTSPVEITKD